MAPTYCEAMTEKIPTILVIIVTWNKKQFVLELLDSLSTLDYPRAAINILVVDNASNDGTAEAITTSHPEVILLRNQENVGGTGGFNTGLQWAFNQSEGQFDYLWLLDNDVLVHRRALSTLVSVLETEPDIAVVGSTMMQLDYPWRINEMGAFIHRGLGTLVLNRHLEELPAWQGQSVQELLLTEADLSKQLMHCNPMMDVDYVAAASLLVRAPVAKQAGLWRDYFIHFDDVEWCLRIAALGHRVVVSAKSLIWHLSAAAKVPTWVLYYDNRNVLDLLKVHGADAKTIERLVRRVLLKSLYYQLIAKPDLAELHHEAVQDFYHHRYGKKNIQLSHQYLNNDKIIKVFLNPQYKKILIAWTVNLQATRIQESLVKASLQRRDLSIECLPLPTTMGSVPIYQLPGAHFLRPLPRLKLIRWWYYWKMRNRYDLVIQSDYQAIIGLNWLNSEILYVNDENFCERSAPRWNDVWRAARRYIASFF